MKPEISFECLKITEDLNLRNQKEKANQLYWLAFYLGKSPGGSESRQRLLSWTFEELVRVASWIKSLGGEISPQWLNIRARLGQ